MLGPLLAILFWGLDLKPALGSPDKHPFDIAHRLRKQAHHDVRPLLGDILFPGFAIIAAFFCFFSCGSLSLCNLGLYAFSLGKQFQLACEVPRWCCFSSAQPAAAS